MPTLDGVLQEMRKGIERLQATRDALQQESEDAIAAAKAAGEAPPEKATRSKFASTMDVLKRLDTSARRCYWKSMSELMFPILFGHMTFASHRCWTVHIKKGVALAAEAWRLQYGNAVRHAARRAGGGEVLHVLRSGKDPYPLLNWSKVERQDATIVYEHKDGFLAQTLDEAYDHDVACKEQGTFPQDKASFLYLQRLITEANQTEEGESVDAEGNRFKGGTSTLEDWLHRGDHPVVVNMSLFVYAMWVYRVEKAAACGSRRPRHVCIDFASTYSLHNSHEQRLATSFRVPNFQGFTMPSSTVDSETAAMFKQLLHRPDLRVSHADCSEGDPLVHAFAKLVEQPPEGPSLEPSKAFSHNWVRHLATMEREGAMAWHTFLRRYEWPLDIWQTKEVVDELHGMWLADNHVGDVEPEHCFDKDKPRATVQQYTAYVGTQVKDNMEGLALARLEKKPRQYQTDAAIHHVYMRGQTGGADGDDDAEGADGPAAAPAHQHTSRFELLPLGNLTESDMRTLLTFGHRKVLTPLTKELLALPCMQWDPNDFLSADLPESHAEGAPHGFHESFTALRVADADDVNALVRLQEEQEDHRGGNGGTPTWRQTKNVRNAACAVLGLLGPRGVHGEIGRRKPVRREHARAPGMDFEVFFRGWRPFGRFIHGALVTWFAPPHDRTYGRSCWRVALAATTRQRTMTTLAALVPTLLPHLSLIRVYGRPRRHTLFTIS